MKVSLKLSQPLEKFMKIDLSDPISKAMTQITLTVQNAAKTNAPYDTGTLRRSITSDFSQIRQGIAIVGSQVPYAKMRHYVNFKNPHTLFYLER